MKKPKSKSSHLDRREFIALSSAVLAGVAMSANAEQLLPASLSPLLSIGYFPGLPKDFKAYGQARQLDCVSAQSLPTGDPSLIRSGAKVRVEAFRRGAGSSPGTFALALTVRFRLSRESDATTPFVAWTYRNDGRLSTESAPSSFYVPVEADDGMQFGLLRSSVLPRRRRSVTNPVSASSVPVDALIRSASDAESRFGLTLDSDASAPKLVPGTYFIALRTDSEQKDVQWSSVRIADVAKGQTLDTYLYERNVLGDRPVSFDYIVLTIAPAERAPAA